MSYMHRFVFHGLEPRRVLLVDLDISGPSHLLSVQHNPLRGQLDVRPLSSSKVPPALRAIVKGRHESRHRAPEEVLVRDHEYSSGSEIIWVFTVPRVLVV